MIGKCELCGRENELTFHHLIPVTLHKNKWFKKNYTREEMSQGINLCKHDCHFYIHSITSNKELGRTYNTKEKLIKHDKIKKYIKWIKSK